MNLSSEDTVENLIVSQNLVHSPAAPTSGHPSRKHNDWFDENDEEIKMLLEQNTASARCIKIIQDLYRIR